MARVVKLTKQQWTLGRRIGDPSGFGQVYEATAEDGSVGIVKLVPKAPGAERELLFENLVDVPNVVPIIDSGESGTNWGLAMPRADTSLRAHIDVSGGRLPSDELIAVLADIATALAALDGSVVHRDLKPANVLLLGGRWCLADFGIARYAEASTAPDTQKAAMSPPYSAPERWRYERATSATDVYSLGVIGWEAAMGARPFPGPTWDDFREQHLHDHPATASGIPSSIASLLDECLYKAAAARPTPTNVLARLRRASTPSSDAAARLQAANQEIVARQAKDLAASSAASTEAERRARLFEAANASLKVISAQLRQAVLDNAPAAARDPRSTADDWSLRLGPASLGMDPALKTSMGNFGRWPPAFDVTASAAIALNIPQDQYGYEGRSHSLWYCDAQEKGVYRWYEMAFMFNPLFSKQLRHTPAAFEPDEKAWQAFANGITEYQLARPVTPIDQGEEEAFINRWLDWFGRAAAGQLQRPSSMPEGGDNRGTYRRS